jgi:hypothetical protein
MAKLGSILQAQFSVVSAFTELTITSWLVASSRIVVEEVTIDDSIRC